jgi:hypothetical protein
MQNDECRMQNERAEIRSDSGLYSAFIILHSAFLRFSSCLANTRTIYGTWL